MTLTGGEGGKLTEIHKKAEKVKNKEKGGERKKDKRPGQTGRSHTREE